jgi:hypothetical protein
MKIARAYRSSPRGPGAWPLTASRSASSTTTVSAQFLSRVRLAVADDTCEGSRHYAGSPSLPSRGKVPPNRPTLPPLGGSGLPASERSPTETVYIEACCKPLATEGLTRKCIVETM